tara:strand:- start:168 stop:419 length:252 start_codon:yes stop_codon:yes gene_type:complete
MHKRIFKKNESKNLLLFGLKTHKRCSAKDLNDENFIFNIGSYPPNHSTDKPKILARSGSLAGVFVMDALPKESVKVLKGNINR